MLAAASRDVPPSALSLSIYLVLYMCINTYVHTYIHIYRLTIFGLTICSLFLPSFSYMHLSIDSYTRTHTHIHIYIYTSNFSRNCARRRILSCATICSLYRSSSLFIYMYIYVYIVYIFIYVCLRFYAAVARVAASRAVPPFARAATRRQARHADQGR